MDRPSGPLGAATQSSTGRGMSDTSPQPVTMRRPVGTPPAPAPATLAGPVPPVPPIPDLRTVTSSTALSSMAAAAAAAVTSTTIAASTSPARVVALFTDAIQNALQENEVQAQRAEGGTTGSDLKPGVTIDLSREGIGELPEEVVDVIKHELERLALSHNYLSTFPARFSECTSLRYLNVRNNRIEEFPLALCDLKSLEILDLGRNRIHVLPPQIVKLTSLKVLSIRKNPIQELPLCIADMASLQVLNLKDNNMTFPPPEILQAPLTSPPNESVLLGSDMVEMAVTAHIKDYLRRVALHGRAESDGGGDESSEGAETPRFQTKRAASGRFPIKINGSEVSDMRSPALNRPPPIPTRSHYRGLSQQSATMRRTSVMPLTIGNVNERIRSNSETGMPQRLERPESRSRRRGILSKKSSDLATLDETQANNNRLSHYRGLSHGSAMQGPGAAKSPASPPEPYTQRPIYVRRLSILPERRRESKVFDPVIESAKGILYSVFQIHPMIQMLMSLTNDGSAKRSSLEIVFYNTNSHVEELEQAIQQHDPANGDGDLSAYHDSGNVHRACQTLVSAYTHVCTLLANNIDTFVDNGDPRYIRTLLVLLYNSIMELRVTMSGIVPEQKKGYRPSAARAAVWVGDTLRPHSRESSVTPTAERHGVAQRIRNGGHTPGPSNLRVATDVPLAPYAIGGIRQVPPLESATPRSGESFVSVGSVPVGRSMADFSHEDRLFEEVFLSLQRSAELVMRALPGFIGQLSAGLRNVMSHRDRPVPEEIVKAWKLTISRATTAVHQTETLKARMALIKLKEPGVRMQAAFWGVCNNFFHAWGTFGETMKEAMTRYKIPIPPDARLRFRPIHQAMKETRDAVLKSPWAYLLQNAGGGGGGGGGGGVLSPLSAHDGGQMMQVPVTPQSAALGPAVQATVPSTPQSASFSGAFSGKNVFERADALINYGGLSMGPGGGGGGGGGPPPIMGGPPSRAGTMSTTSGNSSLSSTMGSVHDGSMTPMTIISPGSSVRMNGRAAF